MTALERPGESTGSSLRQSSLHRYGAVIFQGKLTVLSVAAILSILALLYSVLSGPLYEATARVLIDSGSPPASTGILDFRRGAVSNKITNQLEQLRSLSLARTVAESILRQPMMDSARGVRFPILASVTPPAEDEAVAASVLTEALMKNMSFLPMRESDIIKITARSVHPKEAALLANMFSEHLVERDLLAARAKSRAIREFLESQMSSERIALDSAESELKEYMQSSRMVTLDAEAKRVTEQLSDLEAKRDAIDVECTTRLNTLNSYKKQLAIQEPNVAQSIEQSNDAYVRLLQDQLATLEVQRDIIIAQNPELAGKNIYNKKLKEIDTQIATLKQKLQERTKQFLTTVLPSDGMGGGRDGTVGFLAQVKQKIIEQQIEIDALRARKAALNHVIGTYENQFNRIPAKSMGLAQLQRTTMSNEKLYLLLREKYSEAAITERSEFGSVSIIDPAVPPTRPVGASLLENLLLSLVIGLILGIAVVLLRADLHTRIRNQEDVRERGYRLLSTIGCIGPNRPDEESEDAGERIHALGAILVAHHYPLSPLAESYRYLMNSIMLGGNGHPVKSMIVTSANPQEGKTTTAANLAVTMAGCGQKVLLVDADMRRPALHALFALKKEQGLTDVLHRKITLREAVHKDVVERLDILSSGSISSNPAALLNARGTREIIEQIGQTYDVVLIDTSPVNAVTDAAVLFALADAGIIVVSAGRTKVWSLERAVESLSTAREKILGIVLNNYDLRKAFAEGYEAEGYGYYGYSYTHRSTDDPKKKGRTRSHQPVHS